MKRHPDLIENIAIVLGFAGLIVVAIARCRGWLA